MAEYKERQQDLRLYNVRTITSLEQINDISENVLNSSYAVFAYDNDRTKRYVSHKVKFSDIMDEAFKRSWTYIDVLRDELEYFLHNLDLRFNKTYLNIVKEPIDNGFHDWHNQRLSYFFTINPIISELIEEPDSYIVSYIPEHVVDGVIVPGEYSYLHSSYLTPGLISYTVLQDYIDNTLERLMGVPMTKEQQDQAINSLQEFVDWFTNYTYTDEEYGNLQRLIDTIDRKDENVRLLSYAYTDLARELSYAYTASERDKLSTSINNTFNGLNFTYSCEEHRFLTGIKQVNGKIVEVTDDEGGSNIEVDQNNNTINVNGTQYTLSMTNGKLGFVTVSALEFDATGGGSFEYGATLSDTQKQISYTISKPATVTINNTVITSPYIVTSLNNKTNQTITVKAVPADNYPPECTDTVSFNFNKYKYWAFVDSSDSLTSSNVLSMTAKSAIVNGYPTSRTDFSIGTNESKYIYVMIKKKSSGSFTFKIGQGTEPGQNTGGMTQIEDNITGIYDNNVKYQLWRSTTVKTANCNIIIS